MFMATVLQLVPALAASVLTSLVHTALRALLTRAGPASVASPRGRPMLQLCIGGLDASTSAWAWGQWLSSGGSLCAPMDPGALRRTSCPSRGAPSVVPADCAQIHRL
jgi:hypothetical protein